MIQSFKGPHIISWCSGRSTFYPPVMLPGPQISLCFRSICENAEIFSNTALDIYYKNVLIFKLSIHWHQTINSTNYPAASLQPLPAATEGIWWQIKGQRTNDLKHIPACWYSVCLHDPNFFPVLQGRKIQFKVKDYRASQYLNLGTLPLPRQAHWTTDDVALQKSPHRRNRPMPGN